MVCYECPMSVDPFEINGGNIEKFKAASHEKLVRSEKDLNGFFLTGTSAETTVYEVYEFEGPHCTNLAITIVRPGKVGDEYYMTKGHFHERPNADETYFCLAGNGVLLLQSKDGEPEVIDMTAGSAIYVPPEWAHRTVNTGDDELTFLAVYPKDSGHDYDVILRNGFKKVVVEVDGQPVVRDR